MARPVELRLPPGSVRIEPNPDGRLRVGLGTHCSFDDSRCEARAERLTLESSRQGNTLEVRKVRWGEGSGASRIAVNLGMDELDVTLD